MTLSAVIVSGASLGATLYLKTAEKDAARAFAALEPAGFNILDPFGSIQRGTQAFTALVYLKFLGILVWVTAIGGSLISAFILFRVHGPRAAQPEAVVRKTPQAGGARAARDILKGALKNE